MVYFSRPSRHYVGSLHRGVQQAQVRQITVSSNAAGVQAPQAQIMYTSQAQPMQQMPPVQGQQVGFPSIATKLARISRSAMTK